MTITAGARSIAAPTRVTNAAGQARDRRPRRRHRTITHRAERARASVTFDPRHRRRRRTCAASFAPASDALPKDNDFYFVLSPSRPVSVAPLQRRRRRPAASLYLTTALGISKAPPFKTDVVPRLTRHAGQLERPVPGHPERRVVAVDGRDADLLKRFVEQGGGLLVVLGGTHARRAATWPLLPGHARRARGSHRLAAAARSASPTTATRSSSEFKDPRNGNFANMRFFSYRGLAAGADRSCAGPLRRWRDGDRGAASGQRPRHRVDVARSTAPGTTSRDTPCSCR